MLYRNEKKLNSLDSLSLIHFFTYVSGELSSERFQKVSVDKDLKILIQPIRVNIKDVEVKVIDSLNKETEVFLSINDVNYFYVCRHANDYCCSSTNLQEN